MRKNIYWVWMGVQKESVQEYLILPEFRLLTPQRHIQLSFLLRLGRAAPNDWWNALGVNQKGVRDSGISVNQIAAMAVDTTCCSVVALDGSGNPVRPALIWMDVRVQNKPNKCSPQGMSLANQQ
ncbi:MAG: hypothetical protein Ct9H300mP21_02100 [Pseudomonadota bacterium]|nr:MAG: hypothetical protein Ct9H300mP21_02100 [Pseudomonadota bacterium]